MVLGRAANLTHVAGHLAALVNMAGSLAAADGTWTAVHHVAVRLGLSVEVVALHYALEAAALGRANDIDHLAFREFRNGDYIAELKFGSVFNAKFCKLAEGFGTRFLEVPELGFGHALCLLRSEADLYGLVAVALGCFYLRDRAWTCLYHSHGDESVCSVVHLGHAQFFTYYDLAHFAKRQAESIPLEAAVRRRVELQTTERPLPALVVYVD